MSPAIIILLKFVTITMMSESYNWNLTKTPERLRKTSNALHVKMVGWLHNGQNSTPFFG